MNDFLTNYHTLSAIFSTALIAIAVAFRQVARDFKRIAQAIADRQAKIDEVIAIIDDALALLHDVQDEQILAVEFERLHHQVKVLQQDSR